MKIIGYYFILFCFSVLHIQAQTSDNEELKKMYEEDQKARTVSNINWDELVKKDRMREKRVYELIKAGAVKTGKDYYHSAMIFQHGEDSVAYGMAVKHMRTAINLDTTINRWLLAAAIDRELMSRNKPQIYGTQYIKMGPDAKWERYKIDSSQVTDKDRDYYGVETLAEQKIKEREMNLKSILSFYQQSKSIEQTLDFIKEEHKKGLLSDYKVDENGINIFGYELLKTNQPKDALLIFELNTQFYPDAYNTFDSLGECLLLLHRKEEGIKAYKKSLALNPKNKNAQKIIEQNK